MVNHSVIVNSFIREIKKAKKFDNNLALIFLVGGAGEYILREVAGDYSGRPISKIITEALKNKTINSEQAKILNDIRECRNKYIHINCEKIIDDSRYFYIRDDGKFEDINEQIKNSFSNKKMNKLLKLHILNDSFYIYKTFNQLIKTL